MRYLYQFFVPFVIWTTVSQVGFSESLTPMSDAALLDAIKGDFQVVDSEDACPKTIQATVFGSTIYLGKMRSHNYVNFNTNPVNQIINHTEFGYVEIKTELKKNATSAQLINRKRSCRNLLFDEEICGSWQATSHMTFHIPQTLDITLLDSDSNEFPVNFPCHYKKVL